MKKKKNSQSGIRRTIVKTILFILALPMMVCLCFVLIVFVPPWVDHAKAYSHISQIRYWEIPPDSNVIEVVVEDKFSGNGCYVVGELKIESRLSEDELEEYYTSRYHPQYYSRFIDGDGIYVEPINNQANGDALYIVNVLTNWDCG